MILVRCPECDQEKTPSEFYLDRRATSGRTTYCKPCTRLRNAASRARRLAGAPLVSRRRPRRAIKPVLAEKACLDCRESLPLDAFPRNKNSPDGRHGYCKPCHNARCRETRERLYGGGRHYHLMARYGLTAVQVQEMIDDQKGRCFICRVRPAEHVDHDHETGMVRAILCFTCNAGLGNFGEDRERMQAAIIYLDIFEAAARAAAQARSTA